MLCALAQYLDLKRSLTARELVFLFVCATRAAIFIFSATKPPLPPRRIVRLTLTLPLDKQAT